MPLLKKKDTIAQAQSGMGKTGAFSIATLQLIDGSINETQVPQ
jgi:superfamily II DNA/RNA helicase